MEDMIMNNEKYESPEIQIISVEPDESLMDVGPSMGTEKEPGGI